MPGKNIRLLGGKPLIVWSIDVAKGIEEICDVLVSTDDHAIAEVCKEAGAMVPWLRPEVLATDTATSVDAALHALSWYEGNNGAVDGVILLQPTSPFRTKNDVRQGIDLYRSNTRRSVIGVSPAQSHPMWTFKLDGDHLVPFMPGNGLTKRSQNLPDAYVVNGSFYLSSPDDLRTYKSFGGDNSIPLLVESRKQALDIDDEWDFQQAELICQEKP